MPFRKIESPKPPQNPARRPPPRTARVVSGEKAAEVKRLASAEFYMFSLAVRTAKDPRDYLRSRWEKELRTLPFPEELPTPTIKAVLGYAIQWYEYTVTHNVKPPEGLLAKYDAHLALARGDDTKLDEADRGLLNAELAAPSERKEAPMSARRNPAKPPSAVERETTAAAEAPAPPPRTGPARRKPTRRAPSSPTVPPAPPARKPAARKPAVRKAPASSSEDGVGAKRKDYAATLVAAQKWTDEQIAEKVSKKFTDRPFRLSRVALVRREVNEGKRPNCPKPRKAYTRIE